MGTAYAASSRVWFTFWNGIITEVYYPTVDRPQLRDLQYLITDGKSFFHEEKRHLESRLERLSDHGLGYRCTNSDPAGRYAIVKEIIADPHLACVLQHTRITGDELFVSGLRLYALCAPHLEVGGWGNSGYVARVASRTILIAERKGTYLALAATVPFSHVSCGYVGRSDGWTDLADNFQNGLGVRSRPGRQHRAAIRRSIPRRYASAAALASNPQCHVFFRLIDFVLINPIAGEAQHLRPIIVHGQTGSLPERHPGLKAKRVAVTKRRFLAVRRVLKVA